VVASPVEGAGGGADQGAGRGTESGREACVGDGAGDGQGVGAGSGPVAPAVAAHSVGGAGAGELRWDGGVGGVVDGCRDEGAGRATRGGGGDGFGGGAGGQGVGAGPRGGRKAGRRGPLRVVVDTRARTPQSARVLDDSAPTLVAIAEDADTELKADLLRLPHGDRGLDLDALLRELAAREIVSVFLEGGPTLAGEFLRQGLVDRVVAYIAPALLGSGRAALGAAGVGTIGEIHRLTFDEISPIGPDLRLIARPASQPGRE
jgi:diaminohydroxyphosphoribosylaminopyrimidine deaminase/5-amino-6-(5-phosphoribosylamino)uracil reductase